MVDINEWNIQYSRFPTNYIVNYDFGALANDSPLQVQVDIGDADNVNNDLMHGINDAIIFGRDQVGAMDLIFTLTTVPAPPPFPAPNNPGMINDALDKVSEFAGVWRAHGMKERPGEMAILTNKLRNRWIFGRPRNFSRKQTGLRRGAIQYIASFRTMGPYWFANPSHELVVPRGVNTPQIIGGDVPTWPIITFVGPFTTASLTWNPGVFLNPWTLTINHAIGSDDFIMIDTRPPLPGADDAEGVPRNGWVVGSPMSNCFLSPTFELFPLPPGQFLFTATGSDPTTECQVEWWDSYAGL